MPWCRAGKWGAAALLLVLAGAAWAEAPVLELPIKCTPGTDCFVQNYPDDDARRGTAKDFTCGSATYDGHDGTDIRVVSMEAGLGVAVVAAAPGVVRGVRDEVDDRLIRGSADKAAIKGRECGNGVTVVHADGWGTQYCHMKKGSVRVKPGEQVATGTMLGEVGLSGETQFPHVHLTVRHGKTAVDPFTSEILTGGGAECGAGKGKPLWSKAAGEALGGPRTVILETVFTDRAPANDQMEMGHGGLSAFTRDSGVAMLVARIMHVRKGDRLRIRMALPGGAPFDQMAEPFDRDSAIRLMSGGRKRGAANWPPGQYKGEAEVLREGAVVATGRAEMTLP